jgi:beta-glucosidase
MKNIFYTALLLVALLMVSCQTTKEPAYLNTKLSFEDRVEDLVSRMTLEEKISQLSFESPAIDSLGVPEYNWWNECLHGVARSGLATVFPQAIGMAATWDRDLIYQIGTAISDEGRAKYNDYQSRDKRGIYEGLTFWTPNINIFRDPRWGRGMETYGEDPYLTGEIGVQFINGIQGDHPKYLKAVATSKHYIVHSGPEPERHSFDATTRIVDMRETYLPAFKKTVQEAGVYSVMCAYNRLDGEPCGGSNYLLNELLRDELGFDGYVVSDCGAIRDFFDGHNILQTEEESAALGVKSGTELNCGFVYPSLVKAVKDSLISEAEIDVAVKRLFLARFKMGMFDPKEDVPFNTIPLDVLDSESHKQLAHDAACKSMVLLKNDGLLPLSKDLKKVAVIGPNSNDVEVMLANYNGIPSNPITPYEGIKQKLPNAEVSYALGCEHAKGLPTFEVISPEFFFTDKSKAEAGLKADYYNNNKLEGEPIKSQIDPKIDFYWWDKAPMEELEDDNFGIQWTGVLVPKQSGVYALGAEGLSAYNFYFEDTLFIEYDNIHRASKRYHDVKLEAGKAYKVKVDFMEKQGDANMHLIWAQPKSDLEAEAIALANESDAVVLCMGLSPRLEGEEMKVKVDGFRGGDRLMIDLPKLQQDFIKKIYKTGKPIVLVLINGSALSINWEEENLPAIVEAWYPGQAGAAIADVLFGDYNPAGRLPVMFYKSVNDLPSFEDYDMPGKTYRYFEGEPLYPFGYGLSYTPFVPDNLQVEAPPDEASPLQVSVDIENTGKMDGEEVAQLYLKTNFEQEGRPLKTLKGFERIMIASGDKVTMKFEVSPEELAFFNVDKEEYTIEKGSYTVMIGGSSADEDLITADFVIE